MKKIIFVTDDKFQILALIGAIMKLGFSFEYRHHSASLIVEFSPSQEFFITELADMHEVRTEPFTE